jgi:hypothetical protein
MLTHVVITRMLYKDDGRFLKRLELYKKHLLNSLKKQRRQNFDVAVLCNRRHAEYLTELGVIPFFLKDPDNLGQRDKTWHVKVPWSEIDELEKYYIQSNIDSDDFVSDDYIQMVQHFAEGEEKLLIQFQPSLVDYKTEVIKPMRNKYDEENGSAFCSLYQPTEDNYIYIGQDGHRKMPKYANRTITIGEGYAFVGIHDDNDSTTINS